MGRQKIFLVRIKRTEGGLALTKSHYIGKMLKRFNYFESHPTSAQFDHSTQLFSNKGKPASQFEYSRVIESLMFEMTSTRPDIAFAVGKLSCYTSNPIMQHWQAVHRVLRYLKGTINYGLKDIRMQVAFQI